MDKKSILRTIVETEKQSGLVNALHRIYRKDIKISLGFSKDTCEMSIDELSLSVRSYNALRRAGICVLGELIERLNDGSLKSIRNLGAKSFREIQTRMLVFGYEHLSAKEKAEFLGCLVEENSIIN